LETRGNLVIELTPIGYVEAERPHVEDDFWGGEKSCITLVEGFGADALQGLAEFSHVEITYFFHEVAEAKITTGSRHPSANVQRVGNTVRWREAVADGRRRLVNVTRIARAGPGSRLAYSGVTKYSRTWHA
jgi:hypothetical protein